MHHLKFFFVLLLLPVLFQPVQAAIIFVNTADDELNNDGDCSLREAVEAANTNTSVDNCTSGQSASVDAIFFAVAEDIVLSDGALEITDRVNVVGSGRDTTVIRQEGTDQLFQVNMANTTHDVEFSDMTLRDGFAVVGLHGGAVQLMNGDQFTFSNVAFINNETEVAAVEAWAGGGAIFAGPLISSLDPTLVIEDCLFENNTSGPEAGVGEHGRGGAILSIRVLNGGTLINRPMDAITINDSEFTSNASERSGSAIYTSQVPMVSVSGSQFIGNSMDTGVNGNRRGTIYASGVSTDLLLVSDSTFIGNIAPSNTLGSAVYVQFINGVITNSTFTEHLRRPVAFGTFTNGSLHYSTLVNNGDGSNFNTAFAVDDNSTVSLRGNIIWNRWETDSICSIHPGATFNSLGFNIDNDGSCTGHVDDLPSTDPGLVPLDANGDDIANFDLLTFLPAGPALDGAYANECPAPFGGNVIADARGALKPVDGSETGMNLCDIGAVEYQFDEDPPVSALTVTLQGNGQGEVRTTNFDNIECLSDSCTAYYTAFSQVRLEAQPESGFEFEGWGGACSGTGLCIVNMTLNRTVTATFSVPGFELDVILDGNGTGTVSSSPAGISCPGQCQAVFTADSPVTLTAAPDSGQTFQGWSGACSGTGTCQVTMDQMRRVRAIFLNEDTLISSGFE